MRTAAKIKHNNQHIATFANYYKTLTKKKGYKFRLKNGNFDPVNGPDMEKDEIKDINWVEMCPIVPLLLGGGGGLSLFLVAINATWRQVTGSKFFGGWDVTGSGLWRHDEISGFKTENVTYWQSCESLQFSAISLPTKFRA